MTHGWSNSIPVWHYDRRFEPFSGVINSSCNSSFVFLYFTWSFERLFPSCFLLHSSLHLSSYSIPYCFCLFSICVMSHGFNDNNTAASCGAGGGIINLIVATHHLFLFCSKSNIMGSAGWQPLSSDTSC